MAPQKKKAQPASTAERQAAFRAKLAASGLSEVRGIFAPAEFHSKVKAAAKRVVKRQDGLNDKQLANGDR